jgi:hypothetical protein
MMMKAARWQKVDPVKLMNDFFAAVAFMAKHPQATGKVGITGLLRRRRQQRAAVAILSWPARCRFTASRR